MIWARVRHPQNDNKTPIIQQDPHHTRSTCVVLTAEKKHPWPENPIHHGWGWTRFVFSSCPRCDLCESWKIQPAASVSLGLRKKRRIQTPRSMHYLEANSDQMFIYKISVKSQTPILSSFQPLRKQSRLSGLLWSVKMLAVDSFNYGRTCKKHFWSNIYIYIDVHIYIYR